MKKTLFALTLAVVTCSFVFAEDIIKVLSVYSGGVRTTIPLAGIDSLDHSLYDADSILQSNYTSSIIHAIDRDYQIPINSIDSIVIDKIDVQQFEAQTNEIKEFIDNQTELEVNAFQTNLLTWLNNNENIQEATINEDKDFISIKFKNGMDFSICFQDMSIFEEVEESAETKALRKASDDDDDEPEGGYYDVSYQKGEEIIESPKILYIKGMGMAPLSLYVYKKEWDGITKQKENSPVNCMIEDSYESLDFVNKKFADYGLVIISQTHGGGGGAFMISRPARISSSNAELLGSSPFLQQSALMILTENKNDISEVLFKSNIPVYLIRPSLIEKKLNGNKQTIIYGNYCWSGGMMENVKNNTIVGFETQVQYWRNWKHTVKFINNLLNGNACGDAIKNMPAVPWTLYSYWGVYMSPVTNHPNSKQRYFSISIDDITKKDEKGYPIVTGRINGYKNLKQDEITPSLFIFTPDSVYYTAFYDNIKVEHDGKVTCKISEEIKEGKYIFAIGFVYNGKLYLGESKPGEYKKTPLCPDDNHPHAIDLGLPSGTKWCCCNVGAKNPEDYGGYYAWGETSEKDYYSLVNYAYYDPNAAGESKYIGSDIAGTDYDVAHVRMEAPWRMPSIAQQQELINNCSHLWTQQNGVYGILVTGKNGSQIFLPAASWRWHDYIMNAGIDGSYWSSSLPPNQYGINDTAYHLTFNSSNWDYLTICDRFLGLSVRAVCP
ncbi:MAG: hypothetical protein J6W52_12205 [Bacteroidaceae bacterium]|nr:hypothetical protein [Bacteroidaceae bacterium]